VSYERYLVKKRAIPIRRWWMRTARELIVKPLSLKQFLLFLDFAPKLDKFIGGSIFLTPSNELSTNLDFLRPLVPLICPGGTVGVRLNDRELATLWQVFAEVNHLEYLYSRLHELTQGKPSQTTFGRSLSTFCSYFPAYRIDDVLNEPAHRLYQVLDDLEKDPGDTESPLEYRNMTDQEMDRLVGSVTQEEVDAIRTELKGGPRARVSN